MLEDTANKIFAPLIDIETEDDRWLDICPNAHEVIGRAIEATLSYEKVATLTDVVVLLTNDLEMQKLNAQFRQKNAPTNVLAFPASKEQFKTGELDHLGDIALGFETIGREAAAQQKSFEHHLSHLCVHGILHLLGYDHITEDDAQEMESREVSILSILGICNPYETQ